jgi:hypothetical protein
MLASDSSQTPRGTTKRLKSKHKQDAIRRNCGIAAWRLAAAEYLRKGSFVHLPKKGTSEHATMRRRQMELLPFVTKQIQANTALAQEKKRVKRKAHNLLIRAKTDEFRDKRQAMQRGTEGASEHTHSLMPTRIAVHAEGNEEKTADITMEGGIWQEHSISDSEPDIATPYDEWI